MRKAWRNNGLSLTFLGLFLAALGGQSWAGWLAYDKDEKEHSRPAIGYPAYLVNAHFWQAVAENWESEFLQMGAYIFFTAFLFQKGSAESKDPDGKEEVDEEPKPGNEPPDAPWALKTGGWIRKIYRHSLTLAFMALFLICFCLHVFSGAKKHSAEAESHGQPPVTAGRYLLSSQFWFESMQNWQSEFLAVFSMVTLSIFLRQKGSPESKPLAAPHARTGK